ncbi:UvrD-helicase domain-containing protein [Lysinibacillus tabacifolii]|uniref:DNA 3'-5' helicase n=1 Tax=Lysinibacillus tabacifolii TaxID=1173107 RepID=A0ABY2SU21_9BACI|nr:UvrD-helicase domain-containing protein [Lysinibacillus tabacifolii]TKI46246.1 DNA helicase UvrD [Lysinibacillus tabacifolii]
MFYSSRDPNDVGISHEIFVFEKLREAYKGEHAFGINGFPMFYENGHTNRDIDILFGHKHLGLFVIEVKGIEIDDIIRIRSHNWEMAEGFYCEVMQPFAQALKQRFMLEKYLNKYLQLGKKVNFMTLVALPKITRAEWEKRGFHELAETPIPLFQDDFMSLEALQSRLRLYTTQLQKRLLIEEDWKRLLKVFQVDESETDVAEEVQEQRVTTIEIEQKANEVKKYTVQLFSKLYIINEEQQFEQKRADIATHLREGIKVYLFSPNRTIIAEAKTSWGTFTDKFQLELFAPTITHEPIAFHDIDNGKIDEDVLKKLAHYYEQFNKGQFLAIHCSADINEMITAGAGTGKTHVMIDRILYLIIVARVNLKDIIMITFTNASTNEMRNRLEKKFIELFDLTGRAHFLQFAEEVKTMQISTIHSYAKSVIQTLSHELGYGQSIKLRSFVYEKQQIIQTLVDEYFIQTDVTFFVEHKLKHYEFTKFILKMWEEMEKKGLSGEEIVNLDWGQDKNSLKAIDDLIYYIFKNCEDRLELVKRKQNSVTMGDLIRKLKDFTLGSNKLKQLKQNCFMFIDEFQDSDDVQIEFIAELQKIANYKLFVVGDIKQSIYRFRGADYRSFEELEKLLPVNTSLQKLPLKHNYRSSKDLLQKIDQLFMYWGNMPEPLLTYDATTRLISFEEAKYNQNWIVKPYKYLNDRNKKLGTHIQECLQAIAGTDKKIALLVRTNYEAKSIKEVCKSIGVETLENLDGTFYQSPAVKHFKMLLEGLLYPNEPKYIVNALQTPYFRVIISPQQLMRHNGDRERINEELASLREMTLDPYLTRLREHSVMTIIQMILYNEKVIENLQKYLQVFNPNEKLGQLEAKSYVANLQHLMTLIERTFDQQNLSLHSLVSWLTLQVQTNVTENEPLLDDNESQVTISTVHRSKGLEFDTVILPAVDRNYQSVSASYHIEENEDKNQHRKIGWQIQTEDMTHENIYFEQLNNIELIEQQKEEVRLLYVALTRAKQKLIVFMPETIKPNTWAELLHEAQIGEVN